MRCIRCTDRRMVSDDDEFNYQCFCDQHIIPRWSEVLAFDMELRVLLLKNTYVLFEGFSIAARVATTDK